VTSPAPLDNRACWLLDTLRKLYGELDPGDWPVRVSISALTPERQVVTYGMNAGSSEIARVIADPAALADAGPAIEAAFAGVLTDATIPDGPP